MAERPSGAPSRIPSWAWKLDTWLSTAPKERRKRPGPAHPPAWFWPWRVWHHLSRHVHPTITPRERIVSWARWGAAHEPAIHYSESTVRDDWLHGGVGQLPLTTDCSGFVTLCYRWADAPDPNGLDYHELGYTGTLVDHAAKAGRIITDVSKARPGDPIVIGPGTGEHVVICIESGPDPLVVSHGKEAGPRIQRLSYDGRVPKRVCQTLA